MRWIEEFKRGLKAVAVEEVLDLVVYRPLAFLFVKLIYRTPITPNQITLLSMVFGIAGGIAIGTGVPNALIAAGLLFVGYNVLDCSDGQLARLTGRGSEIGRILDGVADYVASVAMYFGIGVGFASHSSHPVLMWCATAIAGCSNAFQSGLLDYYRNRYLDAVLGRESVLVDGQKSFRERYATLKGERGMWMEKALIWIYLKYSAAQSRYTGGRKTTKSIISVPTELFVREQRAIMHAWTYLGPTTQWTILVVCLFCNRLDVYLAIIGLLMNLIAVVLIFWQKHRDRIMQQKTGDPLPASPV